MQFTWDDTYRTGVEEVDFQHIELFELANKLQTHTNHASDVKTQKEATDFLCKYVINHFYIEETYQERYNYPEYKTHRAMHLRFIQKLTDLKNEIHDNPSAENIEKLSNLVIDWLKEHILKVDKEMGIYITNIAPDDY